MPLQRAYKAGNASKDNFDAIYSGRRVKSRSRLLEKRMILEEQEEKQAQYKADILEARREQQRKERQYREDMLKPKQGVFQKAAAFMKRIFA